MGTELTFCPRQQKPCGPENNISQTLTLDFFLRTACRYCPRYYAEMSNWKSLSRPATELFQIWCISLSMQLAVVNNIFIIPAKMTEFIYVHLPSGIVTSDCLEKKTYLFQKLGRFLTQLCHHPLLRIPETTASLLNVCCS